MKEFLKKILNPFLGKKALTDSMIENNSALNEDKFKVIEAQQLLTLTLTVFN